MSPGKGLWPWRPDLLCDNGKGSAKHRDVKSGSTPADRREGSPFAVAFARPEGQLGRMSSILAALLVLFAAYGAVRTAEMVGRLEIPGLRQLGGGQAADAAFGVVVRVALGLGGIGTLLLALGAVGFPPGTVFAVPTVLLAAAGAWLLPWRALRGLKPRNAMEAGLIFLCVAAAAIMASLALIPWLEIDEKVYHLAVPRAWLNEGGVTAYPVDVHGYFHFLSQMNSLWAMALFPGDVGGPRLLELARSLLAMAGAGALTAWLYGRRAGLVVATVGILLEDVSRWGTTAQIDAGQALYAVAGAGLLMRWLAAPEDRRALALGSLMLGFVVAVKNVGWFFMLAGIIAAALLRIVSRVRFGYGRSEPWKAEALWLFLPGFLAVLPWMIKNTVYTGNPFFPFLWQVFPLHGELEVAFRQFQQYYEPDHRPLAERLIPDLGHLYVVVSNVRTSNVNGLLYWVPLGAMCLILAARYGKDRLDVARWYPVIASLPVLFAFLHAPFWRFFIAAWPVAAISGLGALTLLATTRRRGMLLWGAGALLLYFSVQGFLYVNTQRQLGHRNLGRAPDLPPLTPAQIDAWYLEHDPHAAFLAEVDTLMGPDDRLLMGITSFSIPRLETRFVPNIMCINDEVWFVLANWGTPAEDIAQYIEKLNVTHLTTEKDFPPGPADEFRDRYLEPLLEAERTNARLYRFRPAGNGR